MIEIFTTHLITKLIAFPDDYTCNQENIVNCSTILRPCKKIDYSFVSYGEDFVEDEENWQMTVVEASINNELVTYIEEYFTYDLQSFIGEVGGTFGLFMGVSLLTTLFDLIEFVFCSLKI